MMNSLFKFLFQKIDSCHSELVEESVFYFFILKPLRRFFAYHYLILQ